MCVKRFNWWSNKWQTKHTRFRTQNFWGSPREWNCCMYVNQGIVGPSDHSTSSNPLMPEFPAKYALTCLALWIGASLCWNHNLRCTVRDTSLSACIKVLHTLILVFLLCLECLCLLSLPGDIFGYPLVCKSFHSMYSRPVSGEYFLYSIRITI